jgi:hypothetical protein
MKKVKFLAFDRENKAVYPVIGIRQDSDLHAVWIENKQGVRLWVKATTVELIQYTGLTDFAQHELYDQDIVQDQGRNYLISWNEYEARYELTLIGDVRHKRHIVDVKVMTRLGSAYERPDLV